jgi:hypothetical protein
MHPLLQERGQLKERQLEAYLLQKMEEEKVEVHKANPYPYTTDYLDGMSKFYSECF